MAPPEFDIDGTTCQMRQMKKPVTLVGYDRLVCRPAATFIGLQDGFGDGVARHRHFRPGLPAYVALILRDKHFQSGQQVRSGGGEDGVIPVIETADEHVCTSFCLAVNGRRGDDHLIAAWADKPFSFALGRQTVDVTANELLQLALAFEEEVAANLREFVRPALGHFERKHLHMLFVDQHDSSSALNFSCETLHSSVSTSVR